MTTDEKRRVLDGMCNLACGVCPFDTCYGGRPLGWDDEQIEEVYEEKFPKNPIKNIYTIRRALGIVEGVGLCGDKQTRDALFKAIEMILEVIDKEESL